MKKEIAFIGTMAALMCLAMCSFNITFINGFRLEAFAVLPKRWAAEFVCAFILVLCIMRHVMRAISVRLSFISKPELRFGLVLPFINVLFMAPLMSGFAMFMVNGYSFGFWSLYGTALLRNYPAAWISQILLVGPVVRFIFAPRPQPTQVTSNPQTLPAECLKMQTQMNR